jgi:hypothetical protein
MPAGRSHNEAIIALAGRMDARPIARGCCKLAN